MRASHRFPAHRFPTAPLGRRARAERLVEQLRSVIERHIDEGRLRPGERLATERELAAQFGASRNVVRAALAELDKLGKITRHVGRGTFVKPPAARDEGGLSGTLAERTLDGLEIADASPAELMEFRLALEPGLADAVVLHASDRELAALLDCVRQGEAASRGEEFEYWDHSFHRRLVEATHNRMIIRLYEAVSLVRRSQAWGSLKRQSTDPAKWRLYQAEHRHIAEALAARDADTARQGLRTHLLRVRAKMLDH